MASKLARVSERERERGRGKDGGKKGERERERERVRVRERAREKLEMWTLLNIASRVHTCTCRVLYQKCFYF